VDEEFTVEFVSPSTTWPLRREVLRPGRSLVDVAYPGDDDGRAAHAAAKDAKGMVLAVGSVLPEAPAWQEGGWRVRGMATRPDRRGEGLGSSVLALLLAHVAEHGGGLVWCNARSGALHLYERAGFSPRGDVFQLPDIGPHLVMWREVPAAARTHSPGRAVHP
jgi:GNAT superfamily N-acetyltransferase